MTKSFSSGSLSEDTTLHVLETDYTQENNIVSKILKQWLKSKSGDELLSTLNCNSLFNNIIFSTSILLPNSTANFEANSISGSTLICKITCFCKKQVTLQIKYHPSTKTTKTRVTKARWVSSNFQTHLIKHFDITNKLFIPKISNNRSVKSEVKSEVSTNSSNASEAQPKITSFLRKPSTEPSTENTKEITEACNPSRSKIVPPNLICEAPCNQRNPNVKILDCVIIPPTKRASDLPLSVATLAIPSTSNNNYLPDVTPLLPL